MGGVATPSCQTGGQLAADPKVVAGESVSVAGWPETAVGAGYVPKARPYMEAISCGPKGGHLLLPEGRPWAAARRGGYG